MLKVNAFLIAFNYVLCFVKCKLKQMNKIQASKEIASKSVVFGKKFVDFKLFKKQIQELMTINESTEEKEEMMHDWYIFYKESVYQTVEEFANFWFEDVTKDSHNYWLNSKYN